MRTSSLLSGLRLREQTLAESGHGRSRLQLIRRKAQRGLTLLEIMIVIAILGLLVVIVVPRVMDAFGKSKIDLAKVQVDKFANDYYQRWAIQNNDKGCTDATIEEIGKAVDSKMTAEEFKDPFGHTIKIACDDESKFKGIYSFGENGKDDNGTGDDIRSWERVKK